MFSSSRPFDHLEVVATLGVGGFGRVELVSARRRRGIGCDVPSWLLRSAGEGAGQGRHLCAEGHKEEARGGQQAGGAHPLREEDPRRGSLALRRQVSPLPSISLLSCNGVGRDGLEVGGGPE